MKCPHCKNDIQEYVSRCYYCSNWIHLAKSESESYNNDLSMQKRSWLLDKLFATLSILSEERYRSIVLLVIFSIYVLFLAYFTSLTLFLKEIASYNHLFPLSADEIIGMRKNIPGDFLVFSAALIPTLMFYGRGRFQLLVSVSSTAILLFALIVAPGGDRKGCEECLFPFILSIMSTFILSCVALIVIIVATSRKLINQC